MSLTQQFLRERLRYDAHTGHLIWVKTGRSSRVGTVAGTVKGRGRRYRSIYFGGKLYLAHHLVWLWHRGEMRRGIDHINGNSFDNRIENLREATQSQNLANVAAKKNNKLGERGIVFRDGKYKVYLSKGGKQHYFGAFNSLEAAKDAAREGSIELHGAYSVHVRGYVFVDPSSRMGALQ